MAARSHFEKNMKISLKWENEYEILLHSHHMKRYWFYVINRFLEFSSILNVLRPRETEQTVFTKVSVCSSSRSYTQSLSIELSD